ncbi:MAG TPA: tRNA 2-thiouridine(34) synthase MnmA [Flavobacteriales bacterium]|nr:tRNA 2-thiouridine(34) synthase MnmA [Flavobacteriales bacterium]
MGKKVVVGLSGGVDSSVAAYLLKEQGYEVIAMFMRNWHDESVTLDAECAWIDDSRDALLVAEKLNIPFHVIDLSKPYFERIVEYMFSEYEKGRTPNPDVLCNREIKFDVFLDAAMKLGADYVATGHYCQKDEITVDGKTIYSLKAGADKTKDQSYFLCQVTQAQLSKALFPIGHLQKKEVREIATKLDLVTAGKKDSQGLCFVGKISLPEFLQQKLSVKKGSIVEVEESHIVSQKKTEANLFEQSKAYNFANYAGKNRGEHDGAHYFTVGQRKGFSGGGTKKPLFVLHTDTVKNIVYAGQGEDHPGLYRTVLRMDPKEVNWLRPDKIPTENSPMAVKARIRYRQPLENAELIMNNNHVYLVFERAVRGITPGQFAAWYEGDDLLGSGVIVE